MGQLASFTYIRTKDAPFLGFWSKPKPRWFRRPENKFDEYLRQHALRESVFQDADGYYIALIFGWIEFQDKKCARRYEHPLTESLQKNLGGAHWLIAFEDRQLSLFDDMLPESEWSAFLARIGEGPQADFEWESFDLSRRYVHDRFAELQNGETLLVSVG